MQQTENYKLNLIEASDPFNPDALNENAETLEAQLTRVDAAAAAETARVNAALAAEQSARGAVAASVPKVSYGTFVGDNTVGRFIALPFTPNVLYIGLAETGHSYSSNNTSINYYGGWAFTGKPASVSSRIFIEIAAGGMKVSHLGTIPTSSSASVYVSANATGSSYRYFAIG